jgi:glycosyltransferase involved in cell wall biosynthesis
MSPSPALAEFPHFPDLQSECSLSNARPARVCIASYELLGPSQAGGIGAAYSALARALVGAGHDVTLAHLSDTAAGQDRNQEWVRQFQAQRIAYVRPAASSRIIDVPACMMTSRDAYEWLRRQDFDVIHFPELQGHGYYSVLAKHQGLDFGRTTLCIGVHSPITWIREHNNEPPNSPDELEMDFMERRCVALADVVVSPSQYMLRWMLGRGWLLPETCFVQQNVLDPALRVQTAVDRRGTARVPTELVFFGKLEERKGVGLFCLALDRLARSGATRRLSVTFLGQEGKVSGVPACSYVYERSKGWPFSCRILNELGRDAALRFLAEDPGRVAVVPSLEDNLPNTVLECLAWQIPFLASAVGGIPELIDERDIEQVTFSPDVRDLSERLERATRDGVTVARPAIDAEENERSWINWHASLASRQSVDGSAGTVAAAPAALSPVSICVSYREKPEFLRQAMKSLETQRMRAAEIIVFDYSPESDAHSILSEAGHGSGSICPIEIRPIDSIIKPDLQLSGAKGDYMLFMEGDDYLEEGALNTFVEVANRAGADVLTSFLAVFGGTEEPKPEHRLGESPFLGDAIISGMFHNRFGSNVAFVRKEILARIAPPREGRVSGWHGWEFFARAALAGCRLEVVPRPLAWRRLRDGSGLNVRIDYNGQVQAILPYAEKMPAALRNLPQAGLMINFQYEYFYGLARERLEGDRIRAELREQLTSPRHESPKSLLDNEALVLSLIRQMPARARRRISSALQAWIEYSSDRSQLPAERFRRIPRIARQLLRGRYHRFAHGIGSALRDLGKPPKHRN